MRNRFESQLELLNNDLIAMGALCENAIANAIKAMAEQDFALAKKTIAQDKEIDAKEREIEAMCLKLLLQQQPVAKDLRLISSALKMITDMERIGDQASDIAGIIPFIDVNKAIHSNNILAMAQAVIKMVSDSIDAFVKKDLSLAQLVIMSDDIVDNLFIETKKDLIKLIASDASIGESALDVMMVAKYLERIGDHATNIAEWVVFSITGEHKEFGG